MTEYIEGEIPVEFLYTAGIGYEKFLKELMNEKIIGGRCKKCNFTYVPARIYCERCFSDLEMVEVGKKGILYTYTIVDESIDGKKLEKPIIIGAIKLRGADTLFIHKLYSENEKDIRIGIEVEAEFKE
ncbi:MAG: Zn-ribbon domain-containing OB-fold protein, partial [Candidatus Thermoplasmatota archaeon]